MTDEANPIVIGLMWNEKDDLKYQVMDHFVPPRRFPDYWYSPNAQIEEIERKADPDKVARLSEKDTSGKELANYYDSIRISLEYPLYWEALQINLPINDLFNAKVGSQGDNLKNRVSFQILDTLREVYSKLPGFSFLELAEVVERISKMSTPYDKLINPIWRKDVTEIITSLDADAITRHAKDRLRLLGSSYATEVKAQWDEYEDASERNEEIQNPLMDKLPRRLVVLVTDVETEEDASIIREHNHGILVAVNGAKYEVEPDYTLIRPKTDENPVLDLRRQLHDIIQKSGA